MGQLIFVEEISAFIEGQFNSRTCHVRVINKAR